MNCSLANVVFRAKPFLAYAALTVAFAYLSNVLLGQFVTLGFSVRGLLTPFRNLIGNVVEIGSKEKVVDIYASPVVATVQNMQPIWNRPVRKFPSNAMRTNVSFAPVAVLASHHHSVSVPVDCTNPRNASSGIRNAHLTIKAIFQRATARAIGKLSLRHDRSPEGRLCLGLAGSY